jgi:hypothetical protein
MTIHAIQECLVDYCDTRTHEPTQDVAWERHQGTEGKKMGICHKEKLINTVIT